jgi:hypothetical protein
VTEALSPIAPAPGPVAFVANGQMMFS